MFNFFKKSEDSKPAITIVDKKETIIIIPKGKQVIMAVDFSGSMDENDGSLTDHKSRLQYAKKQTVALAVEAGKIDTDGIDVITFSNDLKTYWNTTSDTVENIFKGGTRGSTKTDLAIEAAYRRHKEIGSTSTFLLLITDGVPDSESAVESAIVKIAKEVKSPDVFMIAILTVGKLNKSTREWLVDLDDNLGRKTGGIDIVSVQPLNGAQFSAVMDAR